MTDSTEVLRKLLNRLEGIRQAYQESGPGNVDGALFQDVESLVAEWTRFASVGQEPLREAIEAGVELGRRCVYRGEGLCFVTGEAGLVPRRDLHEKFEQALAIIEAAVEADSP